MLNSSGIFPKNVLEIFANCKLSMDLSIVNEILWKYLSLTLGASFKTLNESQKSIWTEKQNYIQFFV